MGTFVSTLRLVVGLAACAVLAPHEEVAREARDFLQQMLPFLTGRQARESMSRE